MSSLGRILLWANQGLCSMQPSAHNVPQTEREPGAGSARRLLRIALSSVVTFPVGSALCHRERETWKERAHEELKNPARGRKREISAPGKGNTLLCVCSPNSSLSKGSFHSLLRKNFSRKLSLYSLLPHFHLCYQPKSNKTQKSYKVLWPVK